ncbi:MAG: 5'/3'-nucleotidase SurE [Nitrospirota bacterium]
MPTILVTNDDGIYSPGIQILAKTLKALGDVYIVAPDRERSAVSHSLTLHRPLHADEIKERVYSVNGTPTDCVNIGVNGILKAKPDLVVSGINKGANMGDDITYSGTVMAAIEARILGIPSFAISLVASENYLFQESANFGLMLSKAMLTRGLPDDTLLNVNLPNLPLSVMKGVRITRQGKRIYGDVVTEIVDPRGKRHFWIGGNRLSWEKGEDTDFEAIHEGMISITPLHVDLTNYSAIEKLKPLEETLISLIKTDKVLTE